MNEQPFDVGQICKYPDSCGSCKFMSIVVILRNFPNTWTSSAGSPDKGYCMMSVHGVWASIGYFADLYSLRDWKKVERARVECQI